MKTNILLSTIVGLFTCISSAQSTALTPYNLVGQPNDCGMTVHEVGFEKSWNQEFHETQSLLSPKKGKRPGKKPMRIRYADVSIDSMPNTIFHLTSRRAGMFVGHDGNSGTTLRVRGGISKTAILFLHGSFFLSQKRKSVAQCYKLELSN